MAEIEIVEELSRADADRIERLLEEFGRSQGFPWDEQPLNLVLREQDQIIGGLIGKIVQEWAYIGTLSVAPDQHGRGFGRKLMLEAERIAIERGCRGIWLNTFSYQAPGFYKKLGYEVFGALENYPGRETRYFLMKRLG
jgi:ribosomal protein S18 acetylase RimI-like enzyme